MMGDSNGAAGESTHGDRGGAVLVGAVIALTLVVLVLGLWQTYLVPAEVGSAEFEHSQTIEADMVELSDTIDQVGSQGGERSETVRLGAEYPRYRALLAPQPGAGRLAAEGPGTATIANAVAVDEELARYWSGTVRQLETQPIQYQGRYGEYRNPPTTIIEHGAVVNRFRGDDGRVELAVDGPGIVEGERIDLVGVRGTYDRQSTTDEPVDLSPVSAPARTVPMTGDGAPITITLPTTLDESTWTDLLGDREHVQSINVSPNTASQYDRLQIELDGDVEYDVRLASVGIGEETGSAGPAYIKRVTDQITSGEESIVAEVRDQYNNPVSGATVSVDHQGGCETDDELSTDVNGRVSLSCPDLELVELSIDSVVPGSDATTVVFRSSTGPGPAIGPDDIELDRDRRGLSRDDSTSRTDQYTVTFDTRAGAQLDRADVSLTDADGDRITGETIDLDDGEFDPEAGEWRASGQWESPMLDDRGVTANVTVFDEFGRTDRTGITTDPQQAIEGQVTDSDGVPIEGVEIRITEADGTGGAFTTATDANGRYRIELPDAGTYEVVADGTAVGFQESDPQTVIVGADETQTADFVLEPLDGSISGTVTDEDGTPLEGVRMTAISQRTGQLYDSFTTDDNGQYTIPVRSRQNYDVTADGAPIGFSTATQEGIRVQNQEDKSGVDFTLSSLQGSISGTVFDEGTPLDGVAIRVIDRETGTEVASTTTGADGTYSVDIDSGTYDVIADGSAIGFSIEERVVPVPPGEDITGIDFDMIPEEGSISGQVTRSDGSPLAGVSIQIRDATTDTEYYTTTTDGDGRYSVDLARGTYDVIADGQQLGFSTEVRQDVTVGPGQDVTDVDFDLAPKQGSISGRVTTPAGTSLSGVEIRIVDPSSGVVVATATTGSNGRYSVPVAGDRTYDVVADGGPINREPRYRSGVSVGPGQAVTGVDFVLGPLDGSISGQVLNEGNTPIQGVTIEIRDPETGGVVATTTTNSEGRYTTTVGGDRSYNVRAVGTALQYSTQTQTGIRVDTGASVTDVDFQLDPIGRAQEVRFVPGTVNVVGGTGGARITFDLQNTGGDATITRVGVLATTETRAVSVLGQSPPPTFSGGGGTRTDRITIGAATGPMTTNAFIPSGATRTFTVGDFRRTNDQRQNMVRESFTLAVVFSDGSQRTIVISP